MEKEYPRVLVCAPQNISKSYCFKEWLENLRTFTYPNFSIFLSDNSPTRKFSKYMNKFFDCKWIDPKNKSLDQRIADSHEACRKYAIERGFDAMLHLETDVFPPSNIIELLLSAKRDVIAGLYHIHQGKLSKLMVQLAEKNVTYSFKNTTRLEKDILFFLDGSIRQVFSAGLGCVLINRRVFKKIPFRCAEGFDLRPDSIWACDLFKAGIVFHADTSIICKHKNERWGTYGIDFN